jgi:hypothetical protein
MGGSDGLKRMQEYASIDDRLCGRALFETVNISCILKRGFAFFGTLRARGCKRCFSKG